MIVIASDYLDRLAVSTHSPHPFESLSHACARAHTHTHTHTHTRHFISLTFSFYEFPQLIYFPERITVLSEEYKNECYSPRFPSL